MWQNVRWGMLMGALLILGGLEMASRVIGGFGAPVLYIEHEDIDYMYRPNQSVRRFGNHLAYNEYGMRSPSIAGTPHDRLVLAIGDSILTGQEYVDQADLATSLASAKLSRDGKSVLVGNVSAGSWGPGNHRAWIDTFGFLGADTAIFVLSSHDLHDRPNFAELNPASHPTRRTGLALPDAALHLLPRDVSRGLAKVQAMVLGGRRPHDHAIPTGEEDLSAVLDRVEAAGLRTCLVQHLTRRELLDGPSGDHARIAEIFAMRGVPVLQAGPAMAALRAAGQEPYRDNIHINAVGQAALAELLVACDQIARSPQPADAESAPAGATP